MQDEIKNLVSQLINGSIMFTAFDVTTMLRRANPTVNIRHNVVRDEVRTLFDNGDMGTYCCTNHDLCNGKRANIYHVYGQDLDDYDTNFFSHTTPQSLSVPNLSQTAIPAAVNPQTQTQTQNSQIGSSKPKRARYALDAVPKDKYGRIRVPASVLRSSGFYPKDVVRVIIDPNIITVTSMNDPNGVLHGRKYVVDQYNNIRFHLKDKFTSDKFRMQTKTQRVYITPA